MTIRLTYPRIIGFVVMVLLALVVSYDPREQVDGTVKEASP